MRKLIQGLACRGIRLGRWIYKKSSKIYYWAEPPKVEEPRPTWNRTFPEVVLGPNEFEEFTIEPNSEDDVVLTPPLR